MGTFVDIVNAHKASAFAVDFGSLTAPNITRGLLAALEKSWTSLYNKAYEQVRAPFNWADPATWFEDSIIPGNWSEVEKEFDAFHDAVSNAIFDSRNLVVGPSTIWNRIYYLARMMDIAKATPPVYKDDRQVVKETLTDWGDSAAALGNDLWDAFLAALKWGAVILVGGAVLLYVATRK